MSQTSDVPPVEYDERSSSSPIVRLICWIIIFAIIGLSTYSTWPGRATQADAGSKATNPTIPLLGRYIIGMRGLLDTSPNREALGTVIQQMDDAAKSPADKLRVAIVSGDVLGTEVGTKRLADLLSAKVPTDVARDAQIVQQIYRDGPGTIPATDRDQLKKDCDFFADLALSHGLPSNDPQRAAVLSRGNRTLIVLISAAGVGLVVLIVAVICFVTAIILGSMGKLTLRYLRTRKQDVFLEAFTIYLLTFLGLSLLLHVLIEKFAPNSMSLGWTLLLTPVLPIAMAWPILRGRSWSDTLQSLGWHRGQGILLEIGSGIIGYISMLPVLAVLFFIALQLSKLAGATPTHPIMNYVSKGPMEVFLLYVVACVWAPIIEETMFRGALFADLRARYSWFIAAPLVGFVFAAVHPQGPTLIPALGGIGMAFCGLREWRGSLLAPMAAHALNNGTVLTLLVLSMH